jgi:penicillin-binding protein 1C
VAGDADGLRVLYPADGTRYRLDPVLRPAFQRLHLDGAAPEGFREVHWRADGRRIAGDYRAATWPLAPGTHTLRLHGIDAEGRPRQSAPVTVRVLAGAVTGAGSD